MNTRLQPIILNVTKLSNYHPSCIIERTSYRGQHYRTNMINSLHLAKLAVADLNQNLDLMKLNVVSPCPLLSVILVCYFLC